MLGSFQQFRVVHQILGKEVHQRAGDGGLIDHHVHAERVAGKTQVELVVLFQKVAEVEEQGMDGTANIHAHHLWHQWMNHGHGVFHETL